MTTTPTPDPLPTPPRRHRWLLPLVLVVGLGAAVTGVVLTWGDDEPTQGTAGQNTAAQVSQVQDSCRGWMSSTEPDGGVEDQWCTDMFAWMQDQSGGSMMWQGPEQMGAACRTWVEESVSGPKAEDQLNCDEMIEWMRGHMSSQGGSWMMRGR